MTTWRNSRNDATTEDVIAVCFALNTKARTGIADGFGVRHEVKFSVFLAQIIQHARQQIERRVDA